MGFASLLLYVVLTFLRPTEMFPALGETRLMAIGAGLAAGATLLDLMRGRGPSLRNLQVPLVLLFVLWAAWSVIAAQGWVGGAVAAVNKLFPSVFLFALVAVNVDTLRRLRVLAACLVLLGVCVSLQGILAVHADYRPDLFILAPKGEAAEGAEELLLEEPDSPSGLGLGDSAGRIRIKHLGPLNDPNDLAQALVALLPLLPALYGGARREARWLILFLPAGVMVYAIYLTHSRGGLIALLAVVFLAARARMGRTMAVVATVGATLALLGGGFVAGRGVSGDESSAGRLYAWYDGLQMLKSSPVWGVGFGAFADVHIRAAHNSFVHCFAELGLVGYFLWLGLIVATLIDLRLVATSSEEWEDQAEWRSWATRLWLSLGGFLAGAYFLSRTYGFLLFLLLALPTALAGIARRDEDMAGVRTSTWLVLTVGAVAASVVFLSISVRLGMRFVGR